MRWPVTRTLTPIGLDLGACAVKAVQLRQGRHGVTPAATLALPRLKPGAALTAEEIERIAGVLDRRGFVGRDVVVAVPAAAALASTLELPPRAPGVPVDQIALAEFGRANKLEPAALSVSTWELSGSARASRATVMMAVGARTELLDAHAGLIEAGGLSVLGIDEPYTAAARGGMGEQLHTTANAVPGLTAVIDVGFDAMRIAILRAGQLVYTRKLAEAGLAGVVRALSDVADDPAEAEQALWQTGLAGEADANGGADLLSGHVAGALREIGQAFGYAVRQYPDDAMTDVRLVGGGACVPGLAARFEQTLNVPTRAAAGAAGPIMALAAGLALSEANAMNGRNLLPAHRRTAGRRRRAVRRWVTINVAYASLVGAAAVAYVASRPAPSPVVAGAPSPADVARLTARLAAARSQSAALAAQLRTASEVTDRPDWGRLLAALSRTLGEDAFLSSIESAAAVDAAPPVGPVAARDAKTTADDTPARFVLTGVGRSQEAVTRLVLRLEALGLFARVQIVQTAPQAVRSVDGVGFRILCALPRAGRPA